MKILFLTDNFPPEVNAPATRTFEHCAEWIKLGAEVTVITCFPNFPQGKIYPGYRNKLIQKETMDGIKVIRVWSYMVANKGFLKRSIDFMSYAIMAFMTGLFIRTDVIVATSPQFFTAIAGRKLAWWKRRPWIMEVRDLWPEAIKTVDALKSNFLIKLLEKQEEKCYRSATGIVALTDGVKTGILKKTLQKDKVTIITNGANLELFVPKEKPTELIEKNILKNKLVLNYIGTHGMVYNLEILIKVAKKLEDKPLHVFLIGDGVEKQKLMKLAEHLKVSNITFIPNIQKDKVVDYLALSDITVVSLRNLKLNLGVIPAKIFESAAMLKPILLGVDGEAKSIIEQYHAGLYFEPENESDLIEKITLFLDKKVNLEEMKAGSRKLANDFNRKLLAEKMLTFIEKQTFAK